MFGFIHHELGIPGILDVVPREPKAWKLMFTCLWFSLCVADDGDNDKDEFNKSDEACAPEDANSSNSSPSSPSSSCTSTSASSTTETNTSKSKDNEKTEKST